MRGAALGCEASTLPGKASRFLGAAFLMAVALLTLGCLGPAYLLQAGEGQLDLLCRARPIGRAISDPTTPERVRGLLSEVSSIKKFGVTFGLKPTSSYETYVALDRPRVVWVTSASDPLAFRGRKWRFPIVGSVPYLGWFDRDDARRYAAELEAEGLDVELRGASAYSTLGWFSDPVLSTMLPDGPQARSGLVDVVLHESVHATVYVPGQSTFNESLAEYVSDRLTEEYLTAHGLLPELFARQVSQRASDRRKKRMHDAYVELDALYKSERPKAEKLATKARQMKALREELGLSRVPNNATLLQAKTYGSENTAFGELFERCGTWAGFWKAIRAIEPSAFGGDQSSKFGQLLKDVGARVCSK